MSGILMNYTSSPFFGVRKLRQSIVVTFFTTRQANILKILTCLFEQANEVRNAPLACVMHSEHDVIVDAIKFSIVLINETPFKGC